ncbi:MAG: SCP2 sterol-binding domain-containing protein [Theionarchaea archaeon]|nr:SCP2 sterol-binding domain-containing protein [Theionarchaea archaeon]
MEEHTLTVQVNIQDQNQTFHITTKNRKVTVNKRPCDQPHFILTITTETLCKIYHGEMAALTAAGKAKISDAAPLDWKLPETIEFTPEILAKVYFFIQHFLTHQILKKLFLVNNTPV